MSELKIRNMEKKDIEIIYKHIHHGYVSKYFKDEETQRVYHNEKYEMLLSVKNNIFHIFEDNSGNFIAFVSYKIDRTTSEIAIFLNKEFREKKLSKLILEKSINKFKNENKNITYLEAYILEENIASKKLFSSFNFKSIGKSKKEEIDYLIYRKKLFDE